MAMSTLVTVAFLRNWVVVSLVLLAITSIVMIYLSDVKNVSKIYLYVFILGPLAEAFAIYFGAWTYSNPVIIGIPLYLPFVWGSAGVFISNLAYRMSK